MVDEVLDRIENCGTLKEGWEMLQKDFQGSEKTHQMQILNLKRDFKILRMKDSETIKEFSNRLLK